MAFDAHRRWLQHAKAAVCLIETGPVSPVVQVSLYDFLPAACLKDAVKIFEDFQRDL